MYQSPLDIEQKERRKDIENGNFPEFESGIETRRG
jgi:hypothetical protein